MKIYFEDGKLVSVNRLPVIKVDFTVDATYGVSDVINSLNLIDLRRERVNMENLWRYSINEGDFGGIVIAKTLDKAAEKVTKKYGNKGTIDVWMVKNDDFYDKGNKDVIECYGLGGC